MQLPLTRDFKGRNELEILVKTSFNDKFTFFYKFLFLFQEIDPCEAPESPSNPTQNNNNVTPEKPLAAPRQVPMEIS